MYPYSHPDQNTKASLLIQVKLNVTNNVKGKESQSQNLNWRISDRVGDQLYPFCPRLKLTYRDECARDHQSHKPQFWGWRGWLCYCYGAQAGSWGALWIPSQTPGTSFTWSQVKAILFDTVLLLIFSFIFIPLNPSVIICN